MDQNETVLRFNAISYAIDFARPREMSVEDTLAAAYQFYRFLTVENLDEVDE